MAKKPPPEHTVVVGNIGTVAATTDFAKAQEAYDIYVKFSGKETGRAAGEDVTWFTDGHPTKEHFGYGRYE